MKRRSVIESADEHLDYTSFWFIVMTVYQSLRYKSLVYTFSTTSSKQAS